MNTVFVASFVYVCVSMVQTFKQLCCCAVYYTRNESVEHIIYKLLVGLCTKKKKKVFINPVIESGTFNKR